MARGEKYVNVPRDIEDDYYRYKMPVLRAKVEGRGNGIKTVIENMGEIAKALERPAEYPTKFFGFELGALTKVDLVNDKHIVNGKHDAADLARILDQFIEKYVLCGSCRNPETEMIIKGENIGLRCRACGATSEADPTHRLSSFILKYPPKPEQKKDVQTRRQQKAARQEKSRANAQEKEVTDDDWVLDTSKEAVEARRRELLGANERLSAASGPGDEAGDGAEGEKDGDNAEKAEKEPETGKEDKEDGIVVADGESGTALQLKPGANPLKLLQEYWATKPEDTDIVKQVRGLAARERWSEGQLLKTVFGSLFDANYRKDFYTKADILGLFVNGDKEQKVVLYCVEKLCQLDASVVSGIADLLNGFWEEDVLDETILVKWFNHPNKRLDPKLSRKIRDGSKEFIDWLQNAPEEEAAF